MKKMRNDISIMKFIGIVFVVIGHCTYGTGAISSFIYLLNLPIFFFIAGYLYKDNNEEPWIFFGKKVGRFWKYYFVYNLIFVLLHNVFIRIGILSNIYSYYSFENFLFGIFNSMLFISNEPFSSAMWFIPVLIMSLTIFNAISFYVKNNNEVVRSIFILVLTVLGIVLTNLDINIGLHYQTSLLVLPFIYFGYLLKKYKFRVYKNKIFNILPLILTTIVTFIVIRVIPGRVDMSQNVLWNPFLFYLLSCSLIISIFIFLQLFTNFEKKTILEPFTYIGNNTMSIMCFHLMFIKIVDLISIKMFKIVEGELSIFPFSSQKLIILYVIFSIILSILFGNIVDKFMKRLDIVFTKIIKASK